MLTDDGTQGHLPGTQALVSFIELPQFLRSTRLEKILDRRRIWEMTSLLLIDHLNNFKWTILSSLSHGITAFISANSGCLGCAHILSRSEVKSYTWVSVSTNHKGFLMAAGTSTWSSISMQEEINTMVRIETTDLSSKWTQWPILNPFTDWHCVTRLSGIPNKQPTLSES